MLVEICIIPGENSRPVFPGLLFQRPDVGKVYCQGPWVHGKIEESLFGPGGMRCYVDQQKFELCTREALNPTDLILAERQIEKVAANIQQALIDADFAGARVLFSTDANS